MRPIEHAECGSPLCVAMQRNLQRDRDPALDLEPLEILDVLP